MKKIPEKLKSYAQYNNMKKEMKNVVYNSLNEVEFEKKWNSFVKDFDLHHNQWLSGLYNERHRWVPAFLKKAFWAGMSTTQRSESINAFFDGYINSTTSLQQFVKQFDNALHDKAEKNLKQIFDHSTPSFLAGQIPLLRSNSNLNSHMLSLMRSKLNLEGR